MPMNLASEVQRFDSHGRCVPIGAVAPAHQQSRRYFVCRQPQIDYGGIYQRAVTHLGDKGEISLSAERFEARAQGVFARLQDDPTLMNLTRGVGVPFLIPQDRIDDYGTALESKYVPAVAQAYKQTLPGFDFVSHNTVGLREHLSIAAESRHDRLVNALSEGDVVGWYFPCLLEYSVPAAREVTATLPETCLLAGGVDTCAALVGSPDLLLRGDGYPPLLWLAALNGEKAGIGYHFEAYGYNLTFNRRPHLDKVSEYWCSAIVVLG